jgi:hypothetical protein
VRPLLKHIAATQPAIALLVLLTFAVPVRADGAASRADPESRARADYVEGVALAGQKQWQEAEQRFARVVAFRPAPPALLALGRAEIENGKLATAKATLTLAAASSDPAYASVAAQARQVLAELEPRVPRFELWLPDGVQAQRVTVDGAPSASAGPKELDPRVPHQVIVEADGYQPARMTVTLSEGERRSIQVALVPVPREAPRQQPATADSVHEVRPEPVARPIPPKHDSEAPRTDYDAPNRTGPMLLGGIGVTAGVVGLALRIVGQAAYDTAKTGCTPDCTDPNAVQHGNDARGRMLTGSIVLGVGVAAVVGAGVWWFAVPAGPARSASLRFGVTAESGGALGVVRGQL